MAKAYTLYEAAKEQKAARGVLLHLVEENVLYNMSPPPTTGIRPSELEAGLYLTSHHNVSAMGGPALRTDLNRAIFERCMFGNYHLG
jgi:hypothetical protein